MLDYWIEKVRGDLVETDWVGTDQQVPVEPGSDRWYAPRREQASQVLHEALLALARLLC